MLRVYHLLLGLILLILTPVVIKFVHPNSSTSKLPSTPVQQPHSGTILTQKTSASNPTKENIWKSILGKTTTPPGWKVAPCQGNTPLLCVSSPQELVGTVYMEVYPLAMEPNFQKMLVSAGIPPNAKVDLQNPNYQTQVLIALNTWIADYYAALSKELKGGYSLQPPQQIPFGMLHGMRYELAIKKPDGGVEKQNIGYVAFDGSSLYVIHTAFDPAVKTGKFDKVENLSAFEFYLNSIVADLRLPK